MDQVGVDGAILVVAVRCTAHPSYALEVYAKFRPGSAWCSVRPRRSCGRRAVADWKSNKGCGRHADRDEPGRLKTRPIGITRMLRRRRRTLPVNMYCWGRLHQPDAIAARNPATINNRSHRPATAIRAAGREPWAELPKVLKIAPSQCGDQDFRCTLSHQGL